jgi:hypothetical protein
MLIGHVVPMKFEIVLDVPSCLLTDSVPPRTLLLGFQGSSGIWSMDEVDSWTVYARLRPVKIYGSKIKPTNGSGSGTRLPKQ